jgi:dienelactone hydrolase
MILSTSLQAAITAKEVTYPAGTVTAKGFLARPDDSATRPAVLVVHEWWGLNDYARKRASMLAEMGYVALAIDMYGDGKTADHPSDATAFMTAITENMPEGRARFEAALKFLSAQPGVDPSKIAAIGYCFGGGIVLQMAAEGVPGLIGVASFHGGPAAQIPDGVTPTAAMLVLHGEADAMIPMSAIEDFKNRMTDASVVHKVVTYPDAQHGFTNPGADSKAQEFGLPVGYQENADNASWGELTTFLAQIFGQTPATQ